MRRGIRHRRPFKTAALAAWMLVWSLFTLSAGAQTYAVLYTFKGRADGASPADTVVRGSRGKLYGATYQGGSFRYGVIFRIGPDGKEKVLHNFIGADGQNPNSSLLWDSSGNFYGTTARGGTPEGGKCEHGCGAVYRWSKDGNLTVLHGFNGGADGAVPGGTGRLAMDSAGNFYGTTQGGGKYNLGTVFKIDKHGTKTVLHDFSNQRDGSIPWGGVILDAEGNLYGTTQYGGNETCDCGTVFKIDKDGNETLLYKFKGAPDGMNPYSWLVRDSSGNLYGTTLWGGDSDCGYGQGCGIVFKLDKNKKETILHTFTGAPDGQWPVAGLARDARGNIYGSTQSGGVAGVCLGGCGTVFKIDPSGAETILYAFSGGADGNTPNGVILGGGGNIYGTTFGGGDPDWCGWNYQGCGVVFKIIGAH